MKPVGEHDDDQVALGIDPHRRPGEAGMPERACREILAAASISRTRLPSEPAPSRTRLGKLASNAVGEESRAARDASIDHELREHGEVTCSGEQSGVARHTAECARSAVMHLAACDGFLRGSDARAQR